MKPTAFIIHIGIISSDFDSHHSNIHRSQDHTEEKNSKKKKTGTGTRTYSK